MNGRAADDRAPVVVLVVIVGTTLVNVSAAAVFLGLARGQSAITPSRFLPFTPSGGTAVAVIVNAVLVSVAMLPAIVSITPPIVIFVVEALLYVRVSFSF